MATSNDLFLAILALDSYNRGYLPGIAGLPDEQGTQIGKASIVKTAEDAEGTAQAAAFYAVAYTVPNGAVDGITSVQGILGAADSRRSVACGRSL